MSQFLSWHHACSSAPPKSSSMFRLLLEFDVAYPPRTFCFLPPWFQALTFLAQSSAPQFTACDFQPTISTAAGRAYWFPSIDATSLWTLSILRLSTRVHHWLTLAIVSSTFRALLFACWDPSVSTNSATRFVKLLFFSAALGVEVLIQLVRATYDLPVQHASNPPVSWVICNGVGLLPPSIARQQRLLFDWC